MSVSHDSLKARYENESTERLIEISLKDLLPEAREVLEAVLKNRDADLTELQDYKQELLEYQCKIEKANTRLASRDKRFLAQVIDTLIALAFLPLLYLGYWGQIAGLSLFVFYLWFADGLLGGRSIGKFVLHMRVVRAKDGTPCGYFGSLLRNITLTLLGPIDWLLILGNKKQRLGDLIAGTVVLNSL